ncbi:hypothetical protein [Methanopyrus kandleri]|uniref:Uncharacterized protein n=2 Tax=Methanopyrus kandleri TaxID=2320 RepID=Q8TYF2_METKA|nr:hypothetical protein [Methanopyrus kandleri]AAM01563.1 Uncharacterized protein MK0348 [Methanopyrus kandleri AV19]HII70499.1 hypothetical protein [Methanopyrus kandleri]
MNARIYAAASVLCLALLAASVQWDVLADLPEAWRELNAATELAHKALEEKKKGDELMEEVSATVNAARSAGPLALSVNAPRILEDLHGAYVHYARAVDAIDAAVDHLDRTLDMIGATADPEIKESLKLMHEGVSHYRMALKEFKLGVQAADEGDVGEAFRHVNAAYRMMREGMKLFSRGKAELESKTLLFMG